MPRVPRRVKWEREKDVVFDLMGVALPHVDVRVSTVADLSLLKNLLYLKIKKHRPTTTDTHVRKHGSNCSSPNSQKLLSCRCVHGSVGSSLPWWLGRCPGRGTWRRRWPTWPGWRGPLGGCDPWGKPSDGRGSGHSRSSLRSVEVEDKCCEPQGRYKIICLWRPEQSKTVMSSYSA